MNARIDQFINEDMHWDSPLDMSEPAELPDAEEPEQDVPLGVESDEPSVADDIKQDDEAASEQPTSVEDVPAESPVVEPEASDEDDEDDDEDDDDDDFDEDDEDDEDEDDEEIDESDEPEVSDEEIDLK